MIVDPELYNEPFSIRGGTGATRDPLMSVPAGQAAARGYPDIASGQTWTLAFSEATSSVEALRLDVESLRSRVSELQAQAERLKQRPREMQVTQRRNIGGKEVLTLVELPRELARNVAGVGNLAGADTSVFDEVDRAAERLPTSVDKLRRRRPAAEKLKESGVTIPRPVIPKPDDD